MTQSTMTDNPMWKNFVKPALCKELLKADFLKKPNFYWRGYDNGFLSLVCFHFDTDDYYRSGMQTCDGISRPDYVMGAYTIKDIEQHLPDFCVCRCNNMYEISIDANYRIESCQADRLPDAFAKMMLACIKAKVINLQKIKMIES